ncbi:MAG: T9SS type A sorting domain-containing protein [Candidatus Kapabacteria bacterium]|nr:T9SS type A sorting domain-containing protein [Candidatus Kapabacteria bacterium]
MANRDYLWKYFGASSNASRRIFMSVFLMMASFCLFEPQRLSAQLYFFDGFTDAAVPSAWYNTPQGLGSGFAGANFAGQNLVVLAGRHAVVNGTMLLNGGTIDVQNGGQLTVVGTITGGGTITVAAGGTLRIDGNPNIAGVTGFTFNVGSNLYYTGTTTRDVSSGMLEFPAAGVTANITVNNTSAVGLRLVNYVSVPLNGSLTVSSGTLQLENSSVTCNGSFTFQGNGTCIFGAGAPNLTLNGIADFTNGSFNATAGTGNLNIAGTGSVSGSLRVTSGAGAASALQSLSITRSGSISIGSSFEVADITLGAAVPVLVIPSGRTLTMHTNITTALGSDISVSGTLIYSSGLGAVALSGSVTVSNGGVFQVQAAGFGGTGTVNVQDGGRLRASAVMASGTVQYASGNATLEYFGTGLIAVVGAELPAIMRGSVSVTMSGAGQVYFNGTRTILGTLSIAPSAAATRPIVGLKQNTALTLKGNILTQAGVPTFGVENPEVGTVDIIIDSTSTTPISNFFISPDNALTGNAYLRNFTLNRPTNVDLRSNLVVGPEGAYPNITTTVLGLQRGTITPSVGNRVILLSSNATSLVGGSTSAYVQGTLQRTIRTSASVYFYPVGAAGRFMPFSLINPVTAAPTADATPGIALTPQIAFTGGTSNQIASFASNGRLWTATLTTITGVASFRVQLSDTNLVASNVIVVANSAAGDYAPLSATLFSNTQLTSTAPVGLPTMQSTLAFRIGNTVPGPNISAVAPIVVGSGATVLISGSNFIGVTRVGIGSVTASTYSVLSPTRITAVLPASVVADPGFVNAVSVALSVTAQGGSTASVTTLTYVLPPTITNFFPVLGTPGTPVRIIGTRFGGTLYNTPPTVTFGGVPAQTVIINSPTDITAIVPRNATTGSLRVVTPGGTAATISTFTFIPPPRITDIAPSVAPEGTLVTVSGTGFLQVSEVRFGGVKTQFTLNNSNRLTAVISTGATGFVEIFTPAGIITSATVFTFAPPPLITKATPPILGTGATLELEGFGFVAIPEVRFGNVTAAEVTVSTIRAMSVVVPRSLTPGQYPITVITPGGTTTSSFTVTIVPAPIVSKFTPLSGTTGTIVQILGRNFTVAAIANVRIAGVTAANFQVVSDSLIIAETARISTAGIVSVTALGGTSVAPGVFQNIAPPPIISGFTPTAATTGTLITVVGENFNDANVLQIVNDNQILDFQEFRVVTNGQLTFIMPANATSGTIVIGTSGGFARSPLPITYLPPPNIVQVEPTFGLPGSTFIIRGNNLNGTRQVLLGATPAFRVTQDSPNQLTVVIDPASPLGFDLPITIQAEQGTTRVNNLFSIVTSIQADSLALVEIYRRTVGSGWKLNVNWLTLRPISQWSGVTVGTDSATRGRVVGLSLPQNNAQGSLPLALQFLTALRTLNLSGNPLTGTFPSYITNFRRLEELNVSGMRLSGVLPDSIGNVPNLRVLSVANNSLSGRIPRSLENAVNLQELNLSANALADSIPAFLGNLTSLRIVRLNNNQLVGAIPTTFGAATRKVAALASTPNLQEFDVSSNRISGTIPDNFRTLRKLTVLAAANNRLSGALPIQTLLSMDSLRVLNLGGNGFTGALPGELSQLRRLRYLSLRSNQLDGTLPESLSSLDSLETLWLDSNRFVGAVPGTFENFAALARFGIAGNRITVLPNLLRVRLLNNLNVADNHLDFSSLETNALIDTLAIVPQDSIGEAQRIGAIISIPVRLAVNTGGTANRYQWFRQTQQGEVAVSGVLRDSTFIFPFTSASSGTYTCRVTNTLPELRSLTLYTRPIRIDSAGVPVPPREIPEPIFPLDSITNIVTTASLSWTRTTDASVYDVQLLSGRDTLTVSVSDTAYRLPSVRYETLYYWRVRGRNITGIAPWSVWNPFVTVAQNIEIAAVIPRFPRTPVGDEVRRDLVLISNTTATISIAQLRISDSENSFELLQEIGNNFPLQPGSSINIPVKFSPRTAGRKLGTVTIQYRTVVGGELRTVNFANILQGDGTPLKVVDTDFDLVRVNKRTRAAVLLINRLPRVTTATAGANTNVITISRVEIQNNVRNSFSTLAFQAPLYLGPGDTTALIIRCEPTLSGRLAARLKVVADVDNSAIRRDSSVGSLAANAILPLATDFYAEVAVRTARGQEQAAPGSAVQLEVYYTRANLPTITTQFQQILYGTVRFDRNVLALNPDAYTENLPNSAPLNSISRVQLFPPEGLPRIYPSRARPSVRRDSVLIDSIPCRAVAGSVTETALVYEQLIWGRPGQRTTKVFIEEAPITNTFTATVSRAGGTRLITPAATGSLLTAIQPNPASNETDIRYTVAEQGSISLDVLDMQGQVVKRIRTGEANAGEYTTRIRISDLPSGTYLVRLTTNTEVLTEKLQVIR